MKRVIKFRVWDNCHPGKKHKFWYSDGLGFRLSNFFAWVEQHPVGEKNVQQFTGLLDKNGKEIYEGDICKVNLHGHERIKPISFNSGCFTFDGYGLCQFNLEQKFEVIGNIFENHNLLDKSK